MELSFANGVQEYTVHGVKGDVIIRFNPTDGTFIQRLYNAFDTLDKKQDRPDSWTEHLQRPQRPEERHTTACQHWAQRASWTAGRCSRRWPCGAGHRQRRYGVHHLGGDWPCAQILR